MRSRPRCKPGQEREEGRRLKPRCRALGDGGAGALYHMLPCPARAGPSRPEVPPPRFFARPAERAARTATPRLLPAPVRRRHDEASSVAELHHRMSRTTALLRALHAEA